MEVVKGLVPPIQLRGTGRDKEKRAVGEICSKRFTCPLDGIPCDGPAEILSTKSLQKGGYGGAQERLHLPAVQIARYRKPTYIHTVPISAVSALNSPCC
jgi:hypothetical protein